MSRMVKAAIAGAVALGCLAVVPNEASAMPVSAGLTTTVDAGTAAQGAGVDKVYWRRGWGWRPYYRYGWRRPYLGPRWGWRRPFYGYHPYRRFYRW